MLERRLNSLGFKKIMSQASDKLSFYYDSLILIIKFACIKLVRLMLIAKTTTLIVRIPKSMLLIVFLVIVFA